jgi:hypothetical protein
VVGEQAGRDPATGWVPRSRPRRVSCLTLGADVFAPRTEFATELVNRLIALRQRY